MRKPNSTDRKPGDPRRRLTRVTTKEEADAKAKGFRLKTSARLSDTRSPKSWRQPFLAALRKTPNVSYACDCAKVSRPCAYNERARSAVFRAAWDNALKAGVERLECKLHDFAVGDTPAVEMLLEETVTEQRVKYEAGPGGKPVAVPYTVRRNRYLRHERKVPDVPSAIFLLRRHDPATYGDQSRTVVSTAPGQPLVAKVEMDVTKLPTEELDMIAAEAVRQGLAEALIPTVAPAPGEDDGQQGS